VIHLTQNELDGMKVEAAKICPAPKPEPKAEESSADSGDGPLAVKNCSKPKSKLEPKVQEESCHIPL